MSQHSVEERLSALEKQVAKLMANGTPARPKDWRRTIGMFTDDEGMLEVFREALKIREADRTRARQKNRKSRRAKS